MPAKVAAGTLLVLVLLAPAAWSSGWAALLKDQAIGDFNDEDIREYLDTVYALLDAPLPTAPVQWSNPRTGVGAGLEVIGQPRIAGFAECRRVRTNVYSRKHKSQPRTWTACRDAGGGWRLVKGT
jgi:surface antigen